ncbi:MAG: hypothetical protein IKW44_04210 [Bacteroidaceae bacterium]|nr:hypothetical protein [Bacteroidaceae bacterium]
MKKTFLLAAMLLPTLVMAARWNAETTDWSKNPYPVVGDWGFDRPGYPKGLYIHGITVKEGKRVKNRLYMTMMYMMTCLKMSGCMPWLR